MFYCPKCGAGNLQSNVITETTTEQSTKSYWVCGSCGHKFRHIDELENELVDLETKGKTCGTLSVFILILGLIFLLFGLLDTEYPILNAFFKCSGGFLIFIAGIFWFESKSTKDEYPLRARELEELKKATGWHA